MTEKNVRLLDQLMGKDRNLDLKDRIKQKESYTDPYVCKYQLVSVCPHQLFPNTRLDLGECSKKHDQYFKTMFDNDSHKEENELKYISETIYMFESIIKPVDEKIKRSKQKLENNPLLEQLPAPIQEKLDFYDLQIKIKNQRSEQLGMQGKLEELEEEQLQIERFKKLKEETILTLENPLNNNKAMRICEQCGALQGFNESEYKIQTHILGKVHNGLGVLRKEIEELRRKKDKIQLYLDQKREGIIQSGYNNMNHNQNIDIQQKKNDYDRNNKRENKEKHNRSRSRNKEKEREKAREREKEREKDKEKEKSKKDKKDKRDKKDKKYIKESNEFNKEEQYVKDKYQNPHQKDRDYRNKKY